MKSIVPTQLKIAKVIPLYKCDSLELFQNYRPKSVIPYFLKVLQRLHYFLTINNILQWFISFLCDRKQRVKIGDVYSSYASVSSGVPQGPCTGPLLCIQYANDLPDSHQGSETMVCLFADDTKLSRVLASTEYRFELQEGLNDFKNWVDQWQLRVAEHKCLVLSHENGDPPSYYLKDVNLDNVDHHKDVGVIVDDHCLFTFVRKHTVLPMFSLDGFTRKHCRTN